MEKVITLHNATQTHTSSIYVKNNDVFFSVRIHKEWLFKWLRRIILMTMITGYMLVTIASYSVSPTHFWTLVKAGIIISLVGIITFIKN